MKKNKMMRLASVLLVLTLLSTSVISGTFAKYTTQATGGDSARVAKWGVEAGVAGTLFGDAYKDEIVEYSKDESGNAITVQADVQATDVVAPGTQNTTGMTFTLKGKPEVDTKISITCACTADVALDAGTYVDYTKGEAFTAEESMKPTFTLDHKYYPLVFTLYNGKGEILEQGMFRYIATYLQGLSKTYDTNTDLGAIGKSNITGSTAVTDGVYRLTWAWAYDDAQTLEGHNFNATQVDQADTFLGQVAADVVTSDKASTNFAFTISITAEQVD